MVDRRALGDRPESMEGLLGVLLPSQTATPIGGDAPSYARTNLAL